MKKIIGFFMLSAFAVVLLQATSAYAATITVTTTNMTSQAAGDGVASECSLIDAFAAANTDTAVNACAAGDPTTVATDTIVLPAGTYDLSLVPGGMPNRLDGSATIQGSGIGSTVITNGYIQIAPTAAVPVSYSFTNLTLSQYANIASDMSSYHDTVSLDISHVGLDTSFINLGQTGDATLSTHIHDVNAINGSVIGMTNFSGTKPGDTYISNVTMDGGGSSSYAIWHTNPLANDKMYVQNSAITNYATGVMNTECVPDTVTIGSLYVTNSMIGGGNMQTGIQNTCGHVSVDSTTFHDIAGAAVLAETNHMSTQNSGSGPTCIGTQAYSRLDLTNNTFTAIQPVSISGAPAGIISLLSSQIAECPSQSLTTATTLRMEHNTFAGNTLGSFSSVGVTDETVLSDVTLNNNAFEGSAILGNFTTSGTTSASSNLTTVPFAGPAFLRASFRQVGAFQLSLLRDNGGSAKIGFNQTGGNVLTLRPLWGSPLIDASTTSTLTIDQRNQPRSLLRAFDVGSVESTRGEVLGDGVTLAALTAYLSTGTQLAATGLSFYLVIAVVLGTIIMAYGLVRRYLKPVPVSFH